MTSPTTWLARLSRTTNPRLLPLRQRRSPTSPTGPTSTTGTTGTTSTLRRLTASTTAGGMMLVGTPLMMEYVVRPGDTLSGIAERHDTSVSRLVQRNHLDPSGNEITAGQSISIPAAHGRGGTPGSTRGTHADARRILRYTVRAGDTPSGLAVRFHAWTAELVELNGSTLLVGERIRIPVVPAAARDRQGRGDRGDRGATPGTHPEPAAQHLTAGPGRRADPSRARVRGIIERTARRYGVNPDLALAVSWQEAGWQQHHVSHANAVGAMQIIPSTGDWMSDVVGRDLDLLDVRDNVTAGVALLEVLTGAAPPRQAIAGYYQGLAGVRAHGMYDDTRRYVANVLYLKRRFEQGHYPA